MKYPYLNLETKQLFYVQFPENYAIKLEGWVDTNDMILDVKTNSFIPAPEYALKCDCKTFYIVLSPITKSNIINFPKVEKKLNEGAALEKELVAA